MKKFFISLLLLVLAFVFVACSTKEDTTHDSNETSSEETQIKEKTPSEYELKMQREENASYIAAGFAINNLKNTLKRPSSLEVNIVQVKQFNKYSSGFWAVAIDYSAENSLGGYVRKIAYYDVHLNLDYTGIEKISEISDNYYQDYNSNRDGGGTFNLDIDKIDY